MKKRIIALMLTILISAAALAACGSQENTATEAQTETQAAQAATQTAAATQATQAQEKSASNGSFNAVMTTANVTSDGMINAAELFTDRDLTQNADLSEATSYTVSDNSNISITSAGVYVLTGTASNVTVTVDAADDDKVQIVLDSVSITNDSAPAIYVKNADKVFVTTAENTSNPLSVTGAFTADGDTNTDAVIFSKDDLVLNGLGSLTIDSTDNGVTSKDDLKVTGGTYTITCTSDALEANDSIVIADGSFTISTRKDGLHAENNEDNSTGYIYICGGSFNISAGSDGIQGTTIVQIDGGTFDITASEGIEATFVQLNGGTITINASDDGINGSNKSGAYSVTVEINGGDITVNMGQGDTDGVDSNGNLYINGGTISVNAQSPFDYDGVAQHNGGTIIVNGTETDEITNQMMGGGMGGPGGMMGGDGGMMQGGPGGNMGGGFGR